MHKYNFKFIEKIAKPGGKFLKRLPAHFNFERKIRLFLPIYAFYPSTDPKKVLFSLEKLTQLNGLTTIYGSHNTLGINLSVLNDVKQAIEYLRNNDLDHWGTGVHKIKNIAFQF